MEQVETEEVAKYIDPVVTLDNDITPGNMYYGSRYLRISSKSVVKEGRRGIDYRNAVRLCNEATSNCQMTILSNAYTFASPLFTRKQRKTLLSDVSGYCQTNCMLVDVLQRDYIKFMEVLEDNAFEVLADTEYINPTGSKLHLVYFQIREFEGDEDEDYDEGYDEDEDEW